MLKQDEDDRAGQVALARQLQHLLGVVAARHGQLLGNAEGVIRLVKAGQNAGRFFQQMALRSLAGPTAAK